MIAYLNFNGKKYQLESYLIEHGKGGDPSGSKGKGTVLPLKVGTITALIKYSSFKEPPIDNLIKAAFNKDNGTKYSGSIEVHSNDKEVSKIDFKNAQIFEYAESGLLNAENNTIEITIKAQELTHHGTSLKFEEGLSV